MFGSSRLFRALSCTLLLGLAGCAQERVQEPGEAPVSETAAVGSWGIDLAARDLSVTPGDDFNRYVNGTWIDTTELPPGRGSLSQLNAIYDATRRYLQQAIIDSDGDAAQQPAHVRRIAAAYDSYIDMETRDRLGFSPIQADLDAIMQLASHDDVAAFMGRHRSSGIADTFIWLGLDDTSKGILWIDQQAARQKITGLGRDRYAVSDEAGERVLAGYRTYIADVLTLAGIGDAETRADAVIAIETDLAEGMWGPDKLRDRKLNWHPMPRESLADEAPGFPWARFLEAQGLGDAEVVNLATDTAIQHAAQVFPQYSVNDWQSYLAFHFIDNHRDLLTRELTDRAFDFYGRTVYGMSARESIEDQAVSFVYRRVPDDISRFFVSERFSDADRAEMAEITSYITAAMTERLRTASWLDADTRAEALRKIDHISILIGSQRTWDTRPELTLSRGDPVGVYARTLTADWEHGSYGRVWLGRPFPREHWFLPAYQTDATFSPQLNAVLFPAGILQPPLFDGSADIAVNFGAIGAIMGHEIGHGFDDQGSNFDSMGILRDWWSPQTREAFNTVADRLTAQYAAFEALPGVYLNSGPMIGENLADLIGVTIAHDALKAYMEDHPEDVAERLDGYGPDQRFFMAWAQTHRTVWTEGALSHAARNAHHAPGQFRINGVLRNMDAWYTAFGVTPDDALYIPPEERLSPW